MIYYKGYIVDNEYIKSHKCKIKIGEDTHTYGAQDLAEIGLEINIDQDYLKTILKTYIFETERLSKKERFIDNDEICKCFRNNFAGSINEQLNIINNATYECLSSTFIIYELAKDMNGNLFGRELYTKELFPIYDNKSQSFNYNLQVDKDGNSYYRYYLKIECYAKVSSLLKCDNVIVGHTVADKNDVINYQNKFIKKRFFKKKNEREKSEYKNKIVKLANKNVFVEDFELDENKPKEQKVLENQNVETTLMEEIEYNLLRLKHTSEELYLEYKNKYNKLLETNINKENLALFLGEIEFLSVFKKRDTLDILEYINDYKRKYLDNFINNVSDTTELDLKKLDKINELFLKMKNNYSYKNQRDVLNNLAFLYLMEVYENKDTISIQDLEESYFSMHLKSIVLWINLLMEEDIIECNYLTSIIEELNVKIIFDMIKKIKFKKIENEEIKKIIKTL